MSSPDPLTNLSSQQEETQKRLNEAIETFREIVAKDNQRIEGHLSNNVPRLEQAYDNLQEIVKIERLAQLEANTTRESALQTLIRCLICTGVSLLALSLFLSSVVIQAVTINLGTTFLQYLCQSSGKLNCLGAMNST
jgi:ABC-type multidrug transport system fused ATPase/permease subunit